MADDDQIVVYEPRVDEALEEYLKRYSSYTLKRISENSEKYDQFCSILFETVWRETIEVRKDDALQRLWDVLQDVDNCNVLLYNVDMLEPVRKKLLDSLAKCSEELSSISKWCTVGRILGTTLECIGTVGGLYFSDYKYANLALVSATIFGSVGIGATVLELKLSKDTYSCLIKQIQRDQELFAPIMKWYQQREELKKAMLNVFVFDITSKIVEKFTDILEGKEKFDPVRLFSDLFLALVRQDETLIHNEELIANLVRFTACPDFKNICEWLFFERTHPAIFEIAKMVLQYYYSPIKYLLCQSVRALPQGQQNLYSVPVMLRLLLNAGSVFDGISRLWKPEVPGVHEINHLERHLKQELDALKGIVSFMNRE